jgi:hypothetical protein
LVAARIGPDVEELARERHVGACHHLRRNHGQARCRAVRSDADDAFLWAAVIRFAGSSGVTPMPIK